MKTTALNPAYEPEPVTACPSCETIFEVSWVVCPRCCIRPSQFGVETASCRKGFHDWWVIGSRYDHSLLACGECGIEVVVHGES